MTADTPKPNPADDFSGVDPVLMEYYVHHGIAPNPADTPKTLIGTTVYWFDQNHRVYAPGRTSPPIWRAHWRKMTINAESPRMWIIKGVEPKLPKNGKWPECFARTEAEIDCLAWSHDHAYQISEAVRRLRYAELSAVAELIGYTPKAPK